MWFIIELAEILLKKYVIVCASFLYVFVNIFQNNATIVN
jgi:hypothetical protein